MPFFTKTNNHVLGLDVSASAVKLIELREKGSRYRVESFSIAPLPENAVTDNNYTNVEAVGQVMRTVVERSGTKLKQAALSVTGSAVITKIISIPRPESDEELEAQVELLADQYVPYSLDEVNLDYYIIGPNERDNTLVDVRLAASRRENIEDRIAALEYAGLEAKVIDVEAYVLENSYGLLDDAIPDYGPNGMTAIVDTGATLTTLNIIQNNRVIYSREQGFGGKQLTEEIQRRYGLSYQEAGLAKKKGGLPESFVEDLLDPFKDLMCKQIDRSLQFFFSSSESRSIDHVVLSGGVSALTGIDALLEKKLDIPVAIANPFSQMTLSSRVNALSLRENASSMMVATGLALRSFD
ncbi:MAG: pilus assembly protein PilM [Cycloclasticus sp. symbiont of Poecilosclerida sp. M]|nr:MAG: pilus assembly protein PilM [Cycloclasticus sp. symbiont of Poecilosclerida sp. M]